MWEFKPRSSEALVMGVINVTPDSFSDGGRFDTPSKAYKLALRLKKEGADFLDIGGESSRPGAKPISAKEEIRRVIPTIRKIRTLGIPISIDTVKYDVASAALDEGALIVNDIRALVGNKRLAVKIARSGAGVILMHMKGGPQSMQKNPQYRDVVQEVFVFLKRRAEFALSAGIPAKNISVDPGFGFGKTQEHNWQLLAGLKYFSRLEFPLTVGLSRKSFIGAVCGGAPPEKRVVGSAAAAVAAVMSGANIVRAHDVQAHKQAISVANRILKMGAE